MSKKSFFYRVKPMGKLNTLSFMTILFGGCFYWLSYLCFDQPIAYAFHHLSHDGTLYTFYKSITFLGDEKIALIFIGISFVIAMAMLFRQRYRVLANNLLYMATAMLVAIILEVTTKYLLGRYRPALLFQQGLYGFHYLSHEFLMHSTPSGHATRCFVFVTACSLIFRRLTPIFILLGLLVCLSRLALEFHYLSDVLFGALLGMLVALWVAKIYCSVTIVSLPRRTSTKSHHRLYMAR
jgi:membrane-associated phospholipid phosphatase